MFLLDTVVLSELRKTNRNPGLTAWIREQQDEDLFISVLTIGELRRGICMQERQNPAFAAQLALWLDAVQCRYGNRILPVSVSIAEEWGAMSARLGYGTADVLLAATAHVHHLTVVTRNVRHFEPTGVSWCNPWSV